MKKQTGFTIVELLIVIVVIGILAAITIVAYNGIQTRAKDTTRKSDVAAMAKATAIYTIQSGDKLIDESAKCGSHGAGYWRSNYAGLPSIYQCVSGEATSTDSSDDIPGLPKVDPANTSYMKANCTKDGQQVSYILTNLRGQPQNANFIESICDGPQVSGAWATVANWDTAYGMNYGVRVGQ